MTIVEIISRMTQLSAVINQPSNMQIWVYFQHVPVGYEQNDSAAAQKLQPHRNSIRPNDDVAVKSTGCTDLETAVIITGCWFCFQKIPESICFRAEHTLFQNALHFFLEIS